MADDQSPAEQKLGTIAMLLSEFNNSHGVVGAIQLIDAIKAVVYPDPVSMVGMIGSYIPEGHVNIFYAPGSEQTHTHITTCDRQEIQGIKSIRVEQSYDMPMPVVKLELVSHYINATGRAEFWVSDPSSVTAQAKTVDYVKFRDGTIFNPAEFVHRGKRKITLGG